MKKFLSIILSICIILSSVICANLSAYAFINSNSDTSSNEDVEGAIELDDYFGTIDDGFFNGDFLESTSSDEQYVDEQGFAHSELNVSENVTAEKRSMKNQKGIIKNTISGFKSLWASVFNKDDIYTVLLLDTEASHNLLINGEVVGQLGSPIDDVKIAANRIIDQIGFDLGINKVAIVSFSNSVSTVQDFTDDFSVLRNKVNGLTSGGSFTDVYAAFSRAEQLLDNVPNGAKKKIVFFSQGLPYNGEHSTNGRYSISDCTWHRTDNNICCYEYANKAYEKIESLKSQCEITTVGVYQGFEGAPSAAKSLYDFAVMFNKDSHNSQYNEYNSVMKLVTRHEDSFNDPFKSDRIFIIPVYVYDKDGKRTSATGARVTVYSGSSSGSRVIFTTTVKEGDNDLVTIKKEDLLKSGIDYRTIGSCTVSAHFPISDELDLCSETVDEEGRWNGYRLDACEKLECHSPRFYIEYRAVSGDGLSKSSQSAIDKMYGAVAQMTNGYALIRNVSLTETNMSDSQLEQLSNYDIRFFSNVTEKVNGEKKVKYNPKSRINGYYDDGYITMTIHDRYGGKKEAGRVLAHESGHYVFGFGDEYLAAGNGTNFAKTYNECPRWKDIGGRPTNAPSNFGVMDNQYSETGSLELSTENDYSYMNNYTVTQYATHDENHHNPPNTYTCHWWFYGRCSTRRKFESFLKSKVEEAGYKCDFDVDQNVVMDAEYSYAKTSPEYNSIEVVSNSDIYDNSVITDERIANFEVSENENSFEFSIDDQNCIVIERGIENIHEIELEHADNKSFFNIDKSDLTTLNLSFIKEIDGEYLRNDCSIKYYDAACLGTEEPNHLLYSYNSDSQKVLEISNNSSFEYEKYNNLSEGYYLSTQSEDGNISISVDYHSGIDFDTVSWFFVDKNGNSTKLSTISKSGEGTETEFRTQYVGEGTYVLMAKEVAETNDVSVTINNISQDKCLYDGELSFDLNVSDDSDLKYCQVYYKKYASYIFNKKFSEEDSLILPYSESPVIELGNQFTNFVFAIKVIKSDGSKSELSSTYTYTVKAKDSDNDGIPDWWIDKYPEIAECDDIAYCDFDGDGLNCLTEYKNNTDPLCPDTDGDNVYDKTELIQGLNPNNAKSDGENDDYISLYGQPDLSICNKTFDDENVYFGIKNDSESQAMRTSVEVFDKNDEIITSWEVNIDKKSIIDLGISRELIDGLNSFKIVVDRANITRDLTPENNTYEYIKSDNIHFDDFDIVKNETTTLVNNSDSPYSGDFYRFDVEKTKYFEVDDKNDNTLTAKTVGKSKITASSLSGRECDFTVRVLSFEGAEYSDLEYKLINDNTEASIVNYPGDDSEITIPATLCGVPVTTLENSLNGASGIEKIHTDENSEYFSSYDGILYSHDFSELIRCPINYQARAFSNDNKNLSIAKNAFYKCVNITHINLIGNLTSIGDYAFYNMPNLVSVKMESAVQSIGKFAFGYCSNLFECELPDGLEEIGTYAFYNCNTLAEVALPTTLKSIGAYAYSNDYGLTKLDISDLNAYMNVDMGTSSNPLYYAKNIYLNGTLLTDIVVPESITKINNEIFSGCQCLNSIELHNGITDIGKNAFRENNNLTFIIIPSSVEHINQYAFNGCSGLTAIRVYAGINSIGQGAFYNCSSLENVYFFGSNDEWNDISIESYRNECLLNADIRFDCCDDHPTQSHAFISERLSSLTCEHIGEIKYTCELCGRNYSEYEYSKETQIPCVNAGAFRHSSSVSRVSTNLFNNGYINICNDGQDENFSIAYFKFDISSLYINGFDATSAMFNISLNDTPLEDCQGLTFFYSANSISDNYTSKEIISDTSEVFGTSGMHLQRAKEYFDLKEIAQFEYDSEEWVSGKSFSVDLTDAINTSLFEGKNYLIIMIAQSNAGAINSDNGWSDTNIEYSKASVKVNYLNEENHDYIYVESVIPSCIDYCYDLYVCSRCGYYSKFKIVDNLPHNYELIDSLNPVCGLRDGYNKYQCTDCGLIYQETVPYEHNAHSLYYVKTVAPTCTDSGYDVYKCQYCNITQYTNYISPMNHSYEVTKTTEPTAVSYGIIVYTCSVCGYSYYEYLPILVEWKPIASSDFTKVTQVTTNESLGEIPTYNGMGNPMEWSTGVYTDNGYVSQSDDGALYIPDGYMYLSDYSGGSVPINGHSKWKIDFGFRLKTNNSDEYYKDIGRYCFMKLFVYTNALSNPPQSDTVDANEMYKYCYFAQNANGICYSWEEDYSAGTQSAETSVSTGSPYINIGENYHYIAQFDGERFIAYITDENGSVVQQIVDTTDSTFIQRLNNISTETITSMKIGDDNNSYFFRGLEYRNITFYAGDFADTSAFEAAYEQAQNCDTDDYSAESYNNLSSLITDYSNYSADYQNLSQQDYDDATSNILTAITDLQPYLNLSFSEENGAVDIETDFHNQADDKYSILFGNTVTLTATADEGYEFAGWYDTTSGRVFSTDSTYTFKITSNTSLEARFIKADSASIFFKNDSGYIKETVTKTVDEWNEITSLSDLLPDTPYEYGSTNGRWVYYEAEVLSKLRNGENVDIVAEFDKCDVERPGIPTVADNIPALTLTYSLDSNNNVGSFIMAAGIPSGCEIESIGVAFYYKKASEFNPTDFDLNINNKMMTSKFEASNESGYYTVDVQRFTSYYNWAVKGYVTYYNSEGKLKTVYTNQVNIVDRHLV